MVRKVLHDVHRSARMRHWNSANLESGTVRAHPFDVSISQRRTVALLAVLSLTLPGCTVAGLLIGNSYQKIETRYPTPYSACYGDTVEVVFQDSMGTHLVVGTYQGTLQNEMVLLSASGVVHIPATQMMRLRVKVGTNWVAGMVAGLAIDAFVIATAATFKGGSLWGSDWKGFDIGR